MSNNLREARRSHRMEMTSERKAFIKTELHNGTSKKALCMLFGINYQETQTNLTLLLEFVPLALAEGNADFIESEIKQNQAKLRQVEHEITCLEEQE
ncbi:hypothetical protein [Vibrio owensii]|uniref:hypothetical protein n=1 Tax=Vibrio owensii TaxID=696485 RepID=UPI0018F123AA|nr:hypothetical protein [Vibrio owensii]